MRISFSTKGARLKEWLFVPNAAAVDVEASFNVVNGVYNEVLALPEFIVESVFSRRCDEAVKCVNIQTWVH